MLNAIKTGMNKIAVLDKKEQMRTIAYSSRFVYMVA
jgi:hypothetical protein